MLYTVQVELRQVVTVQIEANTAEEAAESSHDAADSLINDIAFDTTVLDISPRD